MAGGFEISYRGSRPVRVSATLTTPDATIDEVDKLCAQYRISGLPVVDDAGRLVGINTDRDVGFVSGFEQPAHPG